VFPFPFFVADGSWSPFLPLPSFPPSFFTRRMVACRQGLLGPGFAKRRGGGVKRKEDEAKMRRRRPKKARRKVRRCAKDVKDAESPKDEATGDWTNASRARLGVFGGMFVCVFAPPPPRSLWVSWVFKLGSCAGFPGLDTVEPGGR